MSNSKRQEQKGINVTSESFLQLGNVSQRTDDFPTLHKVKSDLNDVINNMDAVRSASSQYNASGAADDDSVYSTSVFSSIVKVHHISQNRDAGSSYNSPRDVSEMTTMMGTERKYMPQDLHKKPIRVQAVLPPAVLCMNPGCVCSHSMGYSQQVPIKSKDNNIKGNRNLKCNRKRKLSDIFQKFTSSNKGQKELYKINIKQQKNGNPKRFVFDRVQEDEGPLLQSVGTNTKIGGQTGCGSRYPKVQQKPQFCCKESSDNEIVQERFKEGHLDRNLNQNCEFTQKDEARVDVYYFDHGNAAYYRTTDGAPTILTEVLAEKAESMATKFWAELFGTVYIAFAFFTAFILQFSRFVLVSIVRPLTIGLLQIISDYFLKPCLALIFNAVIQPPLIFLYNIATSLRDLCDPIAEGLGYFMREISVICKSIRLFEVNRNKNVKLDCAENECNETKVTKEKCEC